MIQLVKPKKILLIDDDEMILRAVQRQLTGEELEVQAYSDPIRALKSINKEDFDIVLCDIKMTPITGLEVLKRIKLNRPGIKVIVMTGYNDKESEKRARRLGTGNYLVKPVRKKELLKAINCSARIF